ncbi:SepM family pheromone-processing serine protease [Lactococcus protaetiae]|uniref:endopeptidase La n=1 Tax=Lactococcus protaetiae TaxID=2592653 RepID=A0A514Z671_9LACT|nr:SepM family pheromone-processing serine protease [Lactococcus protaetiae]MCL2114228.1 PDZ domain-containing protein [Streptococcaceae bacterium]QDK70084.1 PDZ domain-containing protein [Lactococcus protaetiae]
MKKANNKKQSKIIKWSLVIAVVVIAVIALIYPTSYYLEVPGTTEPLGKMVQVEGKKDEHKGDFFLTTVQIAQANVAMMIYSHFNSFATIYSEQQMTGGLNSEQFNLVNQFYMQTAQNTAVYQAFKLADKPYELKYDGVYVLQIAKNSTFKNKLQLADTVTAVNGQHFKSSTEMIDYVSKQKVGDSVTIEYTRIDGSKHKSTGKYIKLENGKTGIGISLTDHTEVVTNPKVTINAGSIGGPSAGMMFTLEIYSQLTGKNLRQGREIAGTGTIEHDGSIGQIGGVDKKVATASKEGADVFIVPDSGTKKNSSNNYLAAKAAAKKLNTKMKIIPVKTIHDALDYLETGKIND